MDTKRKTGKRHKALSPEATRCELPTVLSRAVQDALDHWPSTVTARGHGDYQGRSLDIWCLGVEPGPGHIGKLCLARTKLWPPRTKGGI